MKSRLYCEISALEVEKIAVHCLGGETSVRTYRLLGGGLFNTTYYIETEHPHKALVVRIAPINRQYLYLFEREMMRVEPAIQRIMADTGIPTTKIVQYVPAGEIIDREYSVSTYLPSVPMNDPSLKDADLSHVYEEVGAYMRVLHTIRTEGFGWAQSVLPPETYTYTPDGEKRVAQIPDRAYIRAPHQTWYDFLVTYAEEDIRRMREVSYIPEAEASVLMQILEKYRPLFEKVTESRLTHTDMWQGNVLVTRDETSGRYRTAAIIDADRAICGDIEFDFALNWMGNASFMRAYGERDTGTLEEARLRRTIYSLLYDFFCVYVYSTQFDEPQNSVRCAEQIRQKYAELLK